MLLSLVPLTISSSTAQAATSHVYSGQSIQAAINASAAGDTIIVHDGIYNENIFIDKALTILSENGSVTTTINGTAGGDHAAVTILTSNVNFGATGQGFGITHQWYDAVNESGGMGIAVMNMDSSSLSGITVQGNYVYECGGGPGGSGGGIALGNMGTGSLDDNLVNGNEVFNCNMGIVLINMGAATIYENIIEDNEVHMAAVPVGLMSFDPGAEIYSNEILNNEAYDSGFCILLSGMGGNIYENLIKDNSVHDSFLGITLGEVAGFSGINVYDNIVEGNEVYNGGAGIVLGVEGTGSVLGNIVKGNTVYNMTPIDTAPGSGLSLSNMGSGNVSGNALNGNTVYSCVTGIRIWSSGTGTLQDSWIIGNSIYNNGAGIDVSNTQYVYIYGNDIRDNEDVTTGVHVNNAYDVDIRNNNIAGNSGYGVYKEAVGTASAPYNWWGSSSGPSGNGSGSGDAIGPDINYIPWLTQELSQPPQMFYGTIKTRPNADSPFFNAPIGTVITAKVGGVQKGDITVTAAGRYGNHPGTYLIVQSNITEGATILFYVNGYQALQTAAFHSGEITQWNLNAELYTSTPTPTPSPTARRTATPTPSATATTTSTATPTPTGTPSATASATPAPTSTNVASPTATPMPSPTSSGQPVLTIGFQGTGGQDKMDDKGILLKDVSASSADGTTTANIDAGTQITDPSGQPVDEISIGKISTTPPLPEGYFLIQAYDFKPDGTIFSSALQITLEYDISQLPSGQQPVIAYYDEAAGEWFFLIGEVDPDAGTITFSVAHFTTYALMGPSATPAEQEGIPIWIWIVIGFVYLLALVLVIELLTRRRATPVKVKPDENSSKDNV